MNLAGFCKRCAQEVQDLIELFLVPGLAALLPWWLCYTVFRRIARWDWLYREASQSALRQARQRGWSGVNEAHWLWVRRITTLVDHADLYLCMTRSDAWMRRHLTVQGNWVPGGPAVLCTFHWGAGFWGLRHAAASGLTPHALVAPIDRKHFSGRSLLYIYTKIRVRQVSKTLGNSTLDVSANLRPALQALRRSEQVMAAIDVPADQANASIAVTLLGMPASVPRGLLRLAVQSCVPVQVYLTGLETQTGKRFIRIATIRVHEDVSELAAEIFQLLEQAIADDSPAWHFWGISERFFRPP